MILFSINNAIMLQGKKPYAPSDLSQKIYDSKTMLKALTKLEKGRNISSQR